MAERSLPLTHEDLLARPAREAERILAEIPFRDQLQLVLSTPWALRPRIITLSPLAEGLVRNLPPQELFLTLKAASTDDAIDLLSYAKGEQLQLLLDLDAWRKDRIVAERFMAWLVLFFEAGEDVVARWLEVADFDFLVAVLQRFLRVVKLPEDTELTEALDWLPPYTLDNVYFVEFKTEKFEFYFRRIIEIIRDREETYYYNLMEALIWELPSHVEEMAYRWRRGRLADHGIPDYFDALDIYAPLVGREPRRIDPRYLPGRVPEEEPRDTGTAFLPALAYPGAERFSEALRRITDPAQLDRLQRELAWITNKVLIVDHVNIDEISQVEDSLRKVLGYLNIGVEYLAGPDPEAGARVLETYFLEDIFRTAHTLIVGLRKKAREISSQEGLDPRVLRHLDEPYASYLRGVTVRDANRIRLYLPEKAGTDEEYRWFRELSEVRRVERILEEIGYWAVLIQKAFGTPPLWVAEIATARTNFLEPRDITWSALILTALSNWMETGEFRFAPLPAEKWPEVFRRLLEFHPEPQRNRFRPELEEKLHQNFRWLAQREFYYDRELTESFLRFVISRLEEELAFADPDQPPSPRYLRYILVRL
ncbi:DUF6178 family protein [Thermosulfurimonas sp.]|uniref:DUF6178 family protein n=1 Tax=Thermosulfurimonas sp. TaxID=2080236 RepID=UPI0025CD7B67|nr:DUF6178 family protein [Thermosulfurimonas sp.]